jgi:hypothetical protein
VFEIQDPPARLGRVRVGDRMLSEPEYAWDGHTLWLAGAIQGVEVIHLDFAPNDSRRTSN